MKRDPLDPFEYDVALSFASEDKAVAEQFGEMLMNKGLKVFYDEYQVPGLWGKDPLDHLVNIYARKARYCVVFLSQHYPLKKWTEAERTSARDRAFRDADEYILPLRLDDIDVPGVEQSRGYRDLRQHSVEDIVNSLAEKLTKSKSQSAPPRSHDLRSGNITKSS